MHHQITYTEVHVLVISLELIYAIIIVSYLVTFYNFSRNEGIPLLTNKFVVSIFPFCLSFFFFLLFFFLRLQNCPIHQSIEFFSNVRSISRRKLEFCSWQILNRICHIFDISWWKIFFKIINKKETVRSILFKNKKLQKQPTVFLSLSLSLFFIKFIINGY